MRPGHLDLIRAQRITGRPYGREHPGEPIHIDVMKLGREPDGGGWRALGREAIMAHEHKKVRSGLDYMHAVIDDHSRLTDADVLPDEKAATAPAFLLRAADFYRRNGILNIERDIRDNAFAYRSSAALPLDKRARSEAATAP